MAGQNLIRIAAVALCLSTLSFAAGVAGDLTIIDPPRSGQSVVLRIPPEIPAGAVRAAPLPALLSTASAEASPAPPRAVERSPLEVIELAHEPELEVEVLISETISPEQKPYRDLVLVSAKPRREAPSAASAAKPA